MCCCGQPNVNGTPGYRWQPDDVPRVRPVNPPDLSEGDTLLADEPGRCGGIDHHSHHFRLVMNRFGSGLSLLVRHGGGDERINMGVMPIKDRLLAIDSDSRYWLLASLYSVHSSARDEATSAEAHKWSRAAAEKRIKTRRNRSTVKVWIEPPAPPILHVSADVAEHFGLRGMPNTVID
jgi:hypothetical protein